MFTCRACLRRAITSISHHDSRNLNSIPVARANPPLLSSSAQTASASIREHSTLQSIRQSHHRRLLLRDLARKRPPPPNKRRTRVLTVPEERDLRARTNNASHLENPDYEAKIQKRAAYEVGFVKGDPLQLANAVLSKLRNGGNFAEALELVRASERAVIMPGDREGVIKKGKVENVVSWNHLMDWLMEQGDTTTALKVYNEMKKRGHRPDAHTYTIMLRGLAKHVNKPNAVKDAVNIYNSIFAPNSNVAANTIHTNAVINVCARGGDMDALWSVAGRLPEEGPGAPDQWTYTTIFNAIQEDARSRAARLMALEGQDADTAKIFQASISDGRKMWRDIVMRWQRGGIRIDEPLVCAMGRLLLLSDQRKDTDDVFRLVTQTMNVNLKSMDLQQPGNGGSESAQTENPKVNDQESAEDGGIGLTPHTAKAARTELYAIPSNNTLSMLIEAATIARQSQLGKDSWEVLTSDKFGFNVAPDPGNITAYLRLLRISRASKAALDLLRQEWPEGIARRLYNRGTFVIAMSTCVRDKNNPNVFETAGRILDIMQEKAISAEQAEEGRDAEARRGLRGQKLELDPKVLTMYLSLAMATNGVNAGLPLQVNSNGKIHMGRDKRWHQTLRALKRLGPDTVNVSRLARLKIAEMEQDNMRKGRRMMTPKKGFEDANRVGETLEDLVGLLKGMISAYDRVVGVNTRLEEAKMKPLDADLVNDCMLQKRKLTALLSKVDTSLVKQTGRTGLLAGYDPAKVKADGGEVGDEEDADRELRKTPGMAKVSRRAWKEKKVLETQQENRRLSRRQVQEKERDRRAERLQKMYPAVSRRAEGRKSDALSKQKQSGLVQRGWGGGYERMARQSGDTGGAGLIELGS